MGKRVKIKEVVEKLPKLYGEPILLSFEHSKINPNINLGTRLVAGLYESGRAEPDFSQENGVVSIPKRKQVVIVQGETDMTYVGSSDSHLNSEGGDLRTFIAVRIKKKMRIYEATPIVVSPYIEGRAHLQHQDRAGPQTPQQRTAAQIDLVRSFGAKKKRVSYERREKNKISSEHMNDSINTATESITVVDEIPDTRDESILILTPPINREATDVKFVYSIYDILTEDDLTNMNDLAYQWLNSKEQDIVKRGKV